MLWHRLWSDFMVQARLSITCTQGSCPKHQRAHIHIQYGMIFYVYFNLVKSQWSCFILEHRTAFKLQSLRSKLAPFRLRLFAIRAKLQTCFPWILEDGAFIARWRTLSSLVWIKGLVLFLYFLENVCVCVFLLDALLLGR